MENYIEQGKEVPQLNPTTEVSEDYSSQYTALVGGYHAGGMDIVKYILEESSKVGQPFHMKKYEEVYAGYKNIVNDKNRDRVKKLDELADHMNDLLKDVGNIDEANLRKTCNELNVLVYGDNTRNI